MRNEWRGGGPSPQKKSGDWSGRTMCQKLDVRIAFARLARSSDPDSLRERCARLSLCSEHLSLAVADFTRRSTHRENMSEK